MAWVRRLLGLILALALAATALAYTADATLWNPQLLTKSANDSHLSSELSSQLPAVIASYAPDDQTKTAISAALTPGYVKTQLDQAIPAFVAAYRNQGTPPTLNLTDLDAQFKLFNVAVPPALEKVIGQPIQLVPDRLGNPLATAGSLTALAKWTGPLTALIAAALLGLVGRHHRWRVLGSALFSAAITTAIVAGLCLVPPQLISAAINSSVAKPLEPAISHFTATVTHAQTQLLIKFALVYVAVGMLMFITHGVMGLIAKFHKPKPKEPEPT